MASYVKKMRISVLLITVLLLSALLTGCKKEVSTNSNEKSVGDSYSFRETRLTLPEGSDKILDTCVLTDGTLRIAVADQDLKNSAVWDSKDSGETWEKQMELKDTLSISENVAGWIYLDSGGALLCKVFEDMEHTEDMYYVSSEYYIIDTDGSVNKIQLELHDLVGDEVAHDHEAEDPSDHEHDHDADEEEAIHSHDHQGIINGVSTCTFISDSKLLISDYVGTGYLVDQNTGEVLTTYSIHDDGMEWVNDMESFGDMMIALSPFGTLFYELESGRLTNNSEMELATAGPMDDMQKSMVLSSSLAQKSSDGSIFYYCNPGGIYQYTVGNTFEQIVSSKDIAMSISNLYTHSMAIVDETEFFLTMNDRETDRMYRYSKAEETTKQELNVWTLRENYDLQNAISSYRESNPDVNIKLEIGMTGEDAVTVSDVISNLNTKLLSGNGPDVILLDQMPIQSYIDKGMLADLSDIIRPEEFYDNIIKSYETDEKLYAIPSRFAPMIIVGDEGVIKASSTLADLVDYGKKLKEEDPGAYIFPETNFDEINTFIYYSCLPTWMKEKSVEEAQLKDYLSQIKTIYDLCNNPENVVFSNNQTTGFLTVNYYLLADNKAKICPDFLATPAYQLSGIGAVKNLIPSTGYTSINSQIGSLYIPYSIFGANSQSDSLELAKEFIAFSLSEEAQKNNNGVGNPVNRAALAKTLEVVTETNMESEMGVLVLTALSDEEKQEFIDLVESLDTPVISDGVVMEVVYEQLEEYIFDRISVEQATENIMKKLSLYLVE